MEYSALKHFRDQLREAFLKIEFHQYDTDGSNELSAKEFALFLLSYTNEVRVVCMNSKF